MSVHRAQVTFHGDSGLPEDVYVNTFHFSDDGSATDGLEDLVAAIQGLYLDADSTGRNILSWMSEELNGNMDVAIYDLADAIPRVAQIEDSTAVGGGVTGNGRLPPEVALCVSFQAPPTSGLEQASRRGRVYIGPLGANEHGSPAIGQPIDPATGRPKAAFITTLTEKFADFATEVNALTNWLWVVYSPTLLSAAVISDGWVDNAPDIQRRRGNVPTSRTTFIAV